MAYGIARLTLVSLILLLVGPAARAQTEPTTTQPVPWRQAARLRMDCSQDFRRFCYGVQPVEGRLIQCLAAHRSHLSPTCMSRLAEAQPTLGELPRSQNTPSPSLPSAKPSGGHAVVASALRASCGPDVQTLCAGFSRDIGGMIKCLSSHSMELSPTCEAFLQEMPARPAGQKGAAKNAPPPRANGPAAPPAAASSAAETAPPGTVNDAADTGATSTANDTMDTGASSAANGPAATASPANAAADIAALPAANGAAAAPAAAESETGMAAPSVRSSAGTNAASAANSASGTGELSPAGGPAATAAAPNGDTETGAPSAVYGPATTSAPPAADATSAIGAATAATKKPAARTTLDIRL